MARVPTLLLTGPTGVGKTTVGLEVARLLRGQGVPHAFIDIDALAYCFPVPPDDRFQQRLAMRILADVWRHDEAAGATSLVLARVLESRDGLPAYRRAIPGADLTVVRLRAPFALLMERLQRRGDMQHADRANELLTLMNHARVEDFLIETEGRSPVEVASETLNVTRWPR